MKDVLSRNLGKTFPYRELIDEFKNDPARNYSFDDEFIDGLIESEKDSNNAYYILHLLYSNLDFSNQDFHQDHLHPATIFTDQEKFKKYIPNEYQEFASKSKNWNGVANLQLLNGRKNESKSDKFLKDWVLEENKTNKDLFLSDGISLEIEDFKTFIINRKRNIKNRIKSIIE